jgi:hypothetical protein
MSGNQKFDLRNGARETREKTRKGMRGVGWEAHVASRDPTLDAVGTRSCAIRRGMVQKTCHGNI